MAFAQLFRWLLLLGLFSSIFFQASAQFTYSFAEQTGSSNPLDSIDFYVGRLELEDFDNDGDRDMILVRVDSINTPTVVGITLRARYYENRGTDNTPQYVNTPINAPGYPSGINPTFAHYRDLDGDGDLDRLSSNQIGSDKIDYSENVGTSVLPNFVVRTGPNNPLDSANQTLPTAGAEEWFPTLVDIDNDGDLDCFIAAQVNDWSRWNFFNRDKFIAYYENIGTSTSPLFTFRSFAQNPLNPLIIHGIVNRTRFVKRLLFGDDDNDGDFDLTYLLADGTVEHWINTGSPNAPSFSLNTSNPFANWNALSASAYGELLHIDRLRNGFVTLITSEWNVGPRYFEDRMVGVSSKEPFKETITIGPNPSPHGFTVSWKFTATTAIQWQLISQTGQTIKGGTLPIGQQQLYVPTNTLPAGIYWMTLQGQQGLWQQKIIVP